MTVRRVMVSPTLYSHTVVYLATVFSMALWAGHYIGFWSAVLGPAIVALLVISLSIREETRRELRIVHREAGELHGHIDRLIETLTEHAPEDHGRFEA